MTVFADRQEAGEQLANALIPYHLPQNTLVLALPRGGVPVAAEIASKFQFPLEVFLVRKLGVPGHVEFAFGAVASGGVVYLNDDTIKMCGITPKQIHEVLVVETAELERRERVYRQHPFPDCRGRTLMLVDDGIATGATVTAGLLALRKLQPAKIILATPVAPRSTIEELKSLADTVVVLTSASNFMAIGQFYEDFGQLSDEDVLRYLGRQPD